jgi:hypothetical protein
MNEIGDTIICRHHIHREKDKKYLVEKMVLKKSISNYITTNCGKKKHLNKYLLTLISECGKHKCTKLIYSNFGFKKTRIILIERHYNYIDI